jgi:hypothetical protein
MTCTEDFGKFKATIKHDGSIGWREREVEFDITWVSCGVFEMRYYRPRDAKEQHYVLVAEDWYPPDTSITFTPEHYEKVFELYPSAPKHERDKCYQPFYETYELDAGMFDFGHDWLFQAYKDPLEDRVHLVNRNFVRGNPVESTNVIGLTWADFLRLKEFLDSKKGLIFYSGCRIAMPSKTVTDLQNAIRDATKEEGDSFSI